jgi:calpain-7
MLVLQLSQVHAPCSLVLVTGIEAPFELRLLSSYPIELVPLPAVQTVSYYGAWDAATAGGSNLHGSWVSNPAYIMHLPSAGTCKISLSRIGRSSRAAGSQPLSDMLGCYVIRAARAPSAAGSRRMSTAGALKQAQLFESAFLPADSCAAELQLPAGKLLLVPCTFGPGVVGRFSLSVTAGAAGAGFSLQEVVGGLVAAGEQMMQQA